MNDEIVRLSPSSLGLLLDCPRCFWLRFRAGHERPRGIFPSLPGAMDRVIKAYFDRYRGSLPPELEGRVDGVLMEDQATLDLWRNWKTGLRFVDEELGVELSGALDDCLRDGEVYLPLDYKTRGSAPRPGTPWYYRYQLNLYSLLLNENGYQTDSRGYLVYYFPQVVKEAGAVTFHVHPQRIETSLEDAQALLRTASEVLSGEIPDPAPECEYCRWQALDPESEFAI
ncbi:MAG: PD-(D/E)XK nuclease family protein [Anaerolineae bacterium]